MCLALTYVKNTLLLASGHENGQLYVHTQNPDFTWTRTYTATPHTQPLLSLAFSPSNDYIFTSGADSTISRHAVSSILEPSSDSSSPAEVRTVQTKHSGQQSLTIRSDSKIFATAGWDARVRIYSTRTLQELAVLKWHKEGCYAVAFASILDVPFPDSGSEQVEGSEASRELVRGGSSGVEGVRRAREAKVRNTHYVAAGSKDGKVSLWDIY